MVEGLEKKTETVNDQGSSIKISYQGEGKSIDRDGGFYICKIRKCKWIEIRWERWVIKMNWETKIVKKWEYSPKKSRINKELFL